jgi:hypothetical protein
VDGVTFEGNVIPDFRDGQTHIVEISLGSSNFSHNL